MNQFTARQAIDTFLTTYNLDSFVSDDTDFSEYYLYDRLLASRSAVVEQLISRGEDIPEDMVQVLPCVEFIEVDRQECPCAPASGCFWMKTLEPLPETIHIRSVTDTLANKMFEFVRWDLFRFKLSSRIPAHRKGAYYTKRDTGNGTYLYLYNDRFLEVGSVSAFFEVPADALAFPSCNGVNLEAKCRPYDQNWYVSRKYQNLIFDVTYQDILSKRAVGAVDNYNSDGFDKSQVVKDQMKPLSE